MVVSCTVIRLNPASAAVVDEAIHPVNPYGANRREIQCSGVRGRADRTGLAAAGWLGAGAGIERCGDSARPAPTLQTARPAAAHLRCYRACVAAAPDALPRFR